ncbi:DUF1295 domain-containing protein [Oscillatoria sp. FACHB-1406]|uniref:methyltransferase family protein n=1 Tax=Oscillatoria sp. FACHB-1406 TaxID=2692846 RepID=UPI001681CC05|nr:DUF1295 domain-containing protein [Oscillatoria sp. FACHB-1406]MBD2578206.1 DUF1295 domain-containing protein [Oscillatoria sp. FACHB-1406]
MKIKHVINLHKGCTFFVILGLMLVYQNFTLGSWIYLALHGTYGFIWLLKDRLYPDRQWEQEIPLGMAIPTFLIINLYWIAPYILISSGSVPPLPLVAGAIATTILGIFLHYSSDAQKYYTLKYRPGLITEGFFARCRNTNYLGEILIYTGFALLVQHWLPFAILAGFAALIFIPNMLKKDRSLSRYPEFEEYKANSGLIVPKLWGNRSDETVATLNE